MSKGDSDALLRTYGRAKGRPLSARQARLVEVLLPHLALPADGEIDVEELFCRSIDPLPASPLQGEEERERFPFLPLQGGGEEGVASSALPTSILEIGFGVGEHLVAQAEAHPQARFLGVEPFLNGVAQCLARIEDTGVQNIRLHHGDARDVLTHLPDASLDLVYILFPDPWPKKRHWKRRLIQPDFIAELARVVKPGGEVRFATDWKHYAAWTLELFLKGPRFAWTAERSADWRTRWPGHVPTRYEKKELGDSAPIYLRFERIATI